MLDTDVFVEHSGFAGFLALSLMAALSIAVKSSFTLEVAKRNWPEVYWREDLSTY